MPRPTWQRLNNNIAVKLENPSAAKSTVRKITQDIRALREHGMLDAPMSSITDAPGDYRFLVTGNYITFYRVSGTDVYIDRVLYGRRNYLQVLFGDEPSEP